MIAITKIEITVGDKRLSFTEAELLEMKLLLNSLYPDPPPYPVCYPVYYPACPYTQPQITYGEGWEEVINIFYTTN
ncbi:MAG: hypothetical protein BBJ57_07385 [Desulfobacterales bacterium PC51MH44]|nr:MAG: hypothetical protein BBJ57_07385 [Desulfobacterales bacterium PC51MH44]